ncbi:3203_t:CDS:2, partial [Funneliformis mosseae]
CWASAGPMFGHKDLAFNDEVFGRASALIISMLVSIGAKFETNFDFCKIFSAVSTAKAIKSFDIKMRFSIIPKVKISSSASF